MTSRQPRRYADLSIPRTTWDLVVEFPEADMRLDRFLTKRVDWRSRNELQTLIDAGRITVNGAVRKASSRVKNQDRVVIQLDRPAEFPDPAKIPVEVIYEDGDLLVVNKQPGIVVHPVGRHQLVNLLAALHARYRNHDDPSKDRVPHVCHRIDKDTSGVFLVAFSRALKADVSLQFESRTVKKEYLALVHGTPAEGEGVIDARILYREDAHPRLSIDDAGQPSRTRYVVLEEFADAALVRFLPETGRTHQIRLHAASIGHPLVCDTAYGGRGPVQGGVAASPPLLARCALHSASLSLRHPGTGEPVRFEAPLPADMSTAAAWLRAGGRLDRS